MSRRTRHLALAGLFAVSVTGLFLTVSSIWLEGRFYAALNTLHALTVILGLMYIPFGKLFHIFQRPANLGVTYYKRANAEGDWEKTVELLGPWPSPLSLLLRTAEGQSLAPEVRATLARSLALLGTAYAETNRHDWAEDVMRLGIQWGGDGPHGAAGVRLLRAADPRRAGGQLRGGEGVASTTGCRRPCGPGWRAARRGGAGSRRRRPAWRRG